MAGLRMDVVALARAARVCPAQDLQREGAEPGSLGTILLVPSCGARITTSPALGAPRGTAAPPEHWDVHRQVPALFGPG